MRRPRSGDQRAPPARRRAVAGAAADGAGSMMRNVAPGAGVLFDRLHRAAVQLDEVPDDRQAEAEAAVRARRAGGALAEALEDVRQKRGVDAGAGVAHDDLERCRRARATATSIRPPLGVKRTALDSRFQITCCRRPASPDTQQLALVRSLVTTAIFLAWAAGRIASIAAPTTSGSETGSTSSRSRPDTIARDVEQIVDQLLQRRGVALDGVDRARPLRVANLSGRQHPRPAVDRGQRRAQLVRDGHQELVLQPARLVALAVARLERLAPPAAGRSTARRSR